MKDEIPNPLNVDRVAAILHCEASTVRSKAVSGELRGCKIGTDWIFLPADVESFLQKQIEVQQQRIKSKKESVPKNRRRREPPSLA